MSLKALEKYAHRLLHFIWLQTFAKVASLNIACPEQMPLSENISGIFSYIWLAICNVAPWSTALMVIGTFLGTFCNISLSYVIGKLVEDANTDLQGSVVSSVIILLGLWLSAPLLQLLDGVALLFSSQNLRIAVTDHLTARIMYAVPQALAQNSVGNLVERIELASASISEVVSGTSVTIVKIISVALLSSLLLAGIYTHLAVLAAIWMFSAILVSCYLAYSGMSIVENASDAHAKVIAELTEIISNASIIRSFLAFKNERSRFGKSLARDLYECRKVRSYWLFVLMIETIYKWIFGIFIFVYSVNLYNREILTFSQFVTVCSLVISLSWHFESVAFNFVDLFDSLGVLRASLRELGNIPVDIFCSSKTDFTLPQLGKVEIKSVTAGYGENPILRDINLTIKPGQKVGILGESGSGKSTLLALLRREIYPERGSLEIHGVPIYNLPKELLVQGFSEASQSAKVFNRSIEENICYGLASENIASIETVLEAAQAKSLVCNLPQGLKTNVGEHGVSLSTGERQRIAIARALMKHAPLLILDEATSSVDTISESRILEHVLVNLQGVTVIVVSHRISTLSKFDLLVVMSKGRVVDVGTHNALLKKSSHYQNLLFTCVNEQDL